MNRTNRILIIIAFSIIFGWVISLPYEGPVLYAFLFERGIEWSNLTRVNIFAQALGLLFSGFIISNNHVTKPVLICFLIISFLITTPLIFEQTQMVIYLLPVASFFAGVCNAAIGTYIQTYYIKKNRVLFVGTILITASLFLIVADVIATQVSSTISLIFLQIFLFASIMLIRRIDLKKVEYEEYDTKLSFNKNYWLFYAFIFIITINSGMMFSVIYPYFGQMSLIKSIYTNIPYIAAILLLVFYRKNKFYFLFIGLAMWFVVFILFIFAKPNITYFMIIITLMLFACGIYDMFWWSIMAHNLEDSGNPVKFMGFGLFANLAGVLVGSLIGGAIMAYSHQNQLIVSIIGLCITTISMLIIIPLNMNLVQTSNFLNFLLYQEQFNLINDDPKDILNDKEYAIFLMLLQNLSNKEISEELILSVNTIKYHNKSIYNKLEVENKKELIKKYS